MMSDDYLSTPPFAQSTVALVQAHVFPASFPSWHPQILTSLRQCCGRLTCFHPGIQALLKPEVEWITSLSFEQAIVHSPLSTQQMRDELKRKRILTQHYFVDAILAELVVGKVLNEELFSHVKALTVLACLALMFLKGDNATQSDSTIDDALRSVRLMASTERRQSAATALSHINFIQPIGDLLTALKQQREQFVNRKSVNIHSIAIEAVLRRLSLSRLKQEKHGSREARGRPQTRVELSHVESLDEHVDLLLLRDITRRQGRTRSLPWEEDEERSLTAETQTLLVSSHSHGLMDIDARRWQSQSVAAVMSMRNQLLPCNAALATHEQICLLIDALLNQFLINGSVAAGWNLLQLVMGLSYEDIQTLQVWQTHKILMPQRGHRREHQDGKDRHRDGLWLTSSAAWLQRDVEVSHSRVHKKLRRLLPVVDLLLILPLPDWVLTLYRENTDGVITRARLLESLEVANQTAGTMLTLRQLKNYSRTWFARQGVDSAVVGILQGKTAQQCSPMAYSHLKTQHIVTVWTAYLTALGLKVSPVNTASEDDAVGSSLYPHHMELTTLLSKYHQVVRPYCQQRSRDPSLLPNLHNLRVRHCLLILHLTTAARPVTEMYGRRCDYSLLSRFIRLEDKEARSVSSARLVPLGKRAVSQLQVWESYLNELAAIAVPALSSLSRAARQALDSSGPLFFWAESSPGPDNPIETMHVTPSNMMDQFEPLVPLPPNWHRHAVRSHLVQQHVSTHLIDALMGHEDMGSEFSHLYSNAGLSELFVVSDILDHWHESLRLEVLDGWSIR